MFPTDYIIFLQIILFLFISPGPPRVVIVSHTLNYGLSRSVWTAFGDISANIIQAVLVVFLIGSFLSDNPQVLYYLKWAGIFYVIYLAYDTFNSKIKNFSQKSKNLKSSFSFYKDGLLVAGLSPKAILFFGTIFPTFINFGTNIISQFLILLITYVVLDFITLMIYGLAAEKISIWLRGKPKVLNTISACVLLILAVYIAATQNF
ncbi:MAG: threonine transporter RhtB [Candidatus Pelagibacter sp.]|nr:threonine transporter RhtB [Candidatus Pelagibacter sp.]OUW23661.1 MAG: threonine transporter RhtB [Rickettsiales bacterium TMED174]|tara:strand:+ start:202 stop:816 length:615 start_codon:yes stop_codon:yes gene_type:complete